MGAGVKMVAGKGTREGAGEVLVEKGLDVRWVESEGTGMAPGLGAEQFRIDGDRGADSREGTSEEALGESTGTKTRAETQNETELEGPFGETGYESVAFGGLSRIATASGKNVVELASDTAVDDRTGGENVSTKGMSLRAPSISSNGADESPSDHSGDFAESAYGAFTVEEAEGRHQKEAELEAAEGVPLQFAIAGRPNVGKSTLVGDSTDVFPDHLVRIVRLWLAERLVSVLMHESLASVACSNSVPLATVIQPRDSDEKNGTSKTETPVEPARPPTSNSRRTSFVVLVLLLEKRSLGARKRCQRIHFDAVVYVSSHETVVARASRLCSLRKTIYVTLLPA